MAMNWPLHILFRMKICAPNSCPHCLSKSFHRRGHYYVQILKTYRRRYFCLNCKKSFSTQTTHPTFKQKRPDLNPRIIKLFMNGVSQRATARVLNCSRNTVDVRIFWIASKLGDSKPQKISDVVYIDEMESIEHTKLKPLTMPIAISEHYEILSSSVGRIPAKGLLSKISRKKYGVRENEREKALRELFSDLKLKLPIPPKKVITDGSVIYKKLAKEFFPTSVHEVHVARYLKQKNREMVYLNKNKPFDHLFPLNQRFAKLRSDIKRLTRRSWCTTKKKENLAWLLKLYEAHQVLPKIKNAS
jgi:transposase-like protein